MVDDINKNKATTSPKDKDRGYGLNFDLSTGIIKATNTEAFEKDLEERPVQVKANIKKMFMEKLDLENTGMYLVSDLQAHIDNYDNIFFGNDGDFLWDSKLEDLAEEVLEEIQADVTFIALPSIEAIPTDLYGIALKDARTYHTYWTGAVNGRLQPEDIAQGYITIQAKGGSHGQGGSADAAQMMADQRAEEAFVKAYGLTTESADSTVEHLATTIAPSLSISHEGDYTIQGIGRVRDLQSGPGTNGAIIHEATMRAIKLIAEATDDQELMAQVETHHEKFWAQYNNPKNSPLAEPNPLDNIAKTDTPDDANKKGNKPSLSNKVPRTVTPKPENVIATIDFDKAARKDDKKPDNKKVAKSVPATQEDINLLYEQIRVVQFYLDTFMDDHTTTKNSKEEYGILAGKIKALLNTLKSPNLSVADLEVVQTSYKNAETESSNFKENVVENNFYSDRDAWKAEELTQIRDPKKRKEYKDILDAAVASGDTTGLEGVLHWDKKSGDLLFCVKVRTDAQKEGEKDYGIIDEKDGYAFRAYRVHDNINQRAHLSNLPFSKETQKLMKAALNNSTNPADGIITKIQVADSNDSYELMYKKGQTYLVTNEFKSLNKNVFAAAEENTPDNMLAEKTGLKDGFSNNASGVITEKAKEVADHSEVKTPNNATKPNIPG